MAAYLSALLVCMKPLNLLLIFAMVALGIVFGAIPGLSATLGIALLLPITFGLSTETSFVMLLAIWIGGVSGTFISAVLIGIPGSSSAIATCFDGYPMTQKGQASKALGIGMTASFIGTVCSVAIATVLSPVIAEAALHLGPWEYFSLCFCAITLIASLSKGNIFKGIMSAGIGLLMGCVGMDPINGATRFTFGNVYLTSGISTVAQMLGMFAMCQIIRDNAKGEAKMPDVDVKNMKGLGIGFKDIIENIKTIIFAFASGLWIGFLPGMGSGISNMVAYGYAKGISKDPESFGKGNPAGVWASETANNASLGGALIPMMALGIPGDGITAMLIAGLTIHGLQAGPLFMTEQPDLAMLIFACVMVSAIVTYLIQIVTKRWFPYILKIPYHYLYTVILVISFIGGYGISNTMFNIYVMLALCLLSLFMSVAGLPTSPLVLAFILSSKLERYFRQGISYAHGSYAPFFTRPISSLLHSLLGTCKMERGIEDACRMETVFTEEGIRREHWRIQVEPEVWMTLFLLAPVGAGKDTPVILCPPGHNGAGKYSVAGVRDYPPITEKIDHYHYDYGLQLAKQGCVTVCPDCRGFGERREDPEDTRRLPEGLKGDCYRLAHMGEPLGIPVLGMLTWDLARLIDWLEEDRRFNTDRLGAVGFSGGGMQTLWLTALDDRVKFAAISGYMYGYRDALLTLNNNCSCNYVPHLWEHLDMGDIASLIAPRPLWVQSCREDRLNGPRGVVNAQEQVEIAAEAYRLLGVPENLRHQICPGTHQWHEEDLAEYLTFLLEHSINSKE